MEALGMEPIRAEQMEESQGIDNFLIAFLTLPVLAMFDWGLYVAGVGLLALGFAVYKAWDLTDGQGLDLVLKGPFRVGSGPITATF